MGFSKKLYLFIILFLILINGQSKTQTLQIENMAIKSSGYPVSGAWVLDTNGYVADSVYFSSDGFYKFVIKAKARRANNGWPLVELNIAGYISGPIVVNSSGYIQYTLYSYLRAGKHLLALHYINDSGNRSVTLDWISISPINIDDQEWLVMLADAILERFPDPASYSISDWQIEELMWGVAKAYEITGDPRYLNYVKSHITHHIDENGNLDIGISDTIPGILIIWLYQQTGEERFRICAQRIGEFLVNTYPRTSDGAFIHLPHLTGQLWDDSLGGLGRLLGALALITGNNSYFDEGILQFQLHSAHLQDIQTGLFYHGYDETRNAQWSDPITGRSPEFWARGNGWVVKGFADFLQYLPETYNERQALITIFRRLIDGLVQYQDSTSGLWYTVIDKGNNSDNYLETSGSLLIAYGIYKGCNLGILPESYRQYADKANQGLFRKVFERGSNNIFVTAVSSGTGPGDYQNYVSKKIGTGSDYPYGDGVFLQEKSEVVRGSMPETFFISGQVMYFSNQNAIPAVELTLSGSMAKAIESSVSGAYRFDHLTQGGNYAIVAAKPFNADVHTNDITTYDAALVAQACVGLLNLNNYEKIAADASANGTIEMYDASLIARYSVGLQKLPDCHVGEWVFIPARREYANLNENLTEQNFEGIIIGNVHGGWQMPELYKQEIPAAEISMSAFVVNAGETFEVPIKYLGNETTFSVDLVISYDVNAIEFVEISDIPLPETARLFYNDDSGLLKIGVFQPQPFGDLNQLLKIKFRAKAQHDLKTQLAIEKYKLNNDMLFVSQSLVEIKSKSPMPQKYALSQNYPNPFLLKDSKSGITKIPFAIKDAAQVELVIFNINGEVVKILKKGYEQGGFKEISWNGRDNSGKLVASGIYFYQLKTNQFSAIKKLIIVR